MDDPTFERRVRKLVAALYDPDPAPPIHSTRDKAWIDTSKGTLWSTHDPDRATRLVLLAHRYRLFIQIQCQADAFRVLMLPRNAERDSPAFHPGLGDLIARAYAVAGASAPQAELQLQQARKLLEAMVPILESLASITDEEADILATTRKFLDRSRTK